MLKERGRCMNNNEFVKRCEELRVELNKNENGIPNKICDGVSVNWDIMDNLVDDIIKDTFFERFNVGKTLEPVKDVELTCGVNPSEYEKFRERGFDEFEWIGILSVNLVDKDVSIYVSPFETEGGTYNFVVKNVDSDSMKELGQVYQKYLDGVSESKLKDMCKGQVEIDIIKSFNN